MSREYAVAKGTFDIVPRDINEPWRESARWHYLEDILRQIAVCYGFRELRTPIFERTELFVRGVGEGTDIVTKEMYTFIDRGDRSMTLRPEGTAPLIRCFVEKQMYATSTLHKFFYIGPMFRYERPQAGRYRQFHQFGVEAIGVGSFFQDVEVIVMAKHICETLGLKNLSVQINSVGDIDSRSAYKEALREFLKPHISELSEDSKVRFEKNILRILDSKDPKDQKILQEAPLLDSFLSAESKKHFEETLKELERLKIDYVINPKLVRGLDYYTHTVFEITSDVLGAQNTLVAGGRYDGLTHAIGGPSLPGMGFAIGLERILQTMLKQDAFFPEEEHPSVFFVPMGEEALKKCFEWVCILRAEKIAAEIDLSGKKIQHGLHLANQLGAKYVVVLGEEEIKNKTFQLKNMATRESTLCSWDAWLTTIKNYV